ncbi:hypothetical protein PIB30_088825, partial [Stylosanthes scabra]|nr:hypothetical protein [Stylosanthes scabra]
RTLLYDPPLEEPPVQPSPKSLSKKLKKCSTFFVPGHTPWEIFIWSARYRQEHGLLEPDRRPPHLRSCEDNTNDTLDLSLSEFGISSDYECMDNAGGPPSKLNATIYVNLVEHLGSSSSSTGSYWNDGAMQRFINGDGPWKIMQQRI